MPLPHTVFGLLVHMKSDAYVVIPDRDRLAGVWFEQLIGVSGLDEANDFFFEFGLLLGEGPAAEVGVERDVGFRIGIGIGIGKEVGKEVEVL
jgi:hypothetical protein